VRQGGARLEAVLDGAAIEVVRKQVKLGIDMPVGRFAARPAIPASR
jgi:hypothetical protein